MLTMKPRALFPAVLTTLLCASAWAQPEQVSFSDLVVQAPQLIRLQNELEQMVPPGVSIEAREVYRKGTSGKDLEVRYNIYVKGVPPDATFRQVQWPVDKEKPIAGFSGITLKSDGLMICAGRTPEQCHSSVQLDAPVSFEMQEPLKGEPRRSIFIAPNLRIAISIVPDPVQSEDKGCKLSAIRLSAKFELANIEGSASPTIKAQELLYSPATRESHRPMPRPPTSLSEPTAKVQSRPRRLSILPGTPEGWKPWRSPTPIAARRSVMNGAYSEPEGR